jgi:hypothetical protein
MDSSSDSAMRIRLISLFACCLLLLQMIVIADWVDDVIEASPIMNTLHMLVVISDN